MHQNVTLIVRRSPAARFQVGSMEFRWSDATRPELKNVITEWKSPGKGDGQPSWQSPGTKSSVIATVTDAPLSARSPPRAADSGSPAKKGLKLVIPSNASPPHGGSSPSRSKALSMADGTGRSGGSPTVSSSTSRALLAGSAADESDASDFGLLTSRTRNMLKSFLNPHNPKLPYNIAPPAQGIDAYVYTPALHKDYAVQHESRLAGATDASEAYAGALYSILMRAHTSLRCYRQTGRLRNNLNNMAAFALAICLHHLCPPCS